MTAAQLGRLVASTRQAELGSVDRFLERARAGPAALVIEGEAGIGKTTLWWAALEHAAAEHGIRVLAAQGSPTEVQYAYAVVADLVRGTLDDDGVLESLPARQRAAVERVVHGGSDGPPTDERVVAAAFLTIIERVGSQSPVLVAIDDTQWLDVSSRAVLGYVARRLVGRTGLLATVRTGDSATVGEPDWLRLPRPDAVDRIRLAPLSLGGVHALISARLGRTLPRPAITRIHEVSGGNPFFAAELAGAVSQNSSRIADELPASLAALVRQRIGECGGETAAVLLAAACAAAPTVELIGQATGIAAANVVELLESVEDRGVITIDGNRVRFTHPLYATGVYTDSVPSRRRSMHRALAEIIGTPEIKARHLALAATTGDPSTKAALDAAADVALSKGAPAVAAELLELAIKLDGDTPARRIRAGELHFRAGTLDHAHLHVKAGLAALEPGTLRCIGLMLLAAVQGYGDDLPSAIEALAAAVSEAEEPAVRLQALLLLTPAEALTGDFEKSVEHARAAVELAERLGSKTLHSQALAIWVMVSFHHGLGADARALQTALEHERPNSSAAATYQATAVAAVIAGWTGELSRARDEIAAVQRHYIDRGSEIDILWAAEHAVIFDVWSARFADASRTAEDALQRAEQMGGGHVLIKARTGVAAVASYTGHLDVARAAARAAIDAAVDTGGHYMAIAPTSTLIFVEVSTADYDAALAMAEPLLATFDAVHDAEIVVGAWLPDAIEALTAAGRPGDAEKLVEALERNGIRHDRPWMLAMGARGRGHVLAARGDVDGAQRAVEQAMAHHRRLPMPFEEARSQLLLGQLQRRGRRRQAAAASLRAALENFERLGTPLWAGRARAELSRMDNVRGDGQGLSTAEQRAAALAASGLSNKQIAAELFIAEKTVEMNLSRVYRKLGIRSRAQLSAALRNGDVQGNP